MPPAPALTTEVTDALFVKVAREIAVDHFDIETILERYQITDEKWSEIQRNPYFVRVLRSEIEDWHSATNTHERTKLKAAALIEEWLSEANSQLHNNQALLSARVELAKLLTRIAGMGESTKDGALGSSEKFSITINLGNDAKLNFQKQVTTKVIDVSPDNPDA